MIIHINLASVDEQVGVEAVQETGFLVYSLYFFLTVFMHKFLNDIISLVAQLIYEVS